MTICVTAASGLELPPPPRPAILSTMTLKNAATLALIGTLLLTLLLAIDVINSVLSVARGLVPAMLVLRTLIYFFASVTVRLSSTSSGERSHGRTLCAGIKGRVACRLRDDRLQDGIAPTAAIGSFRRRRVQLP